MIRLKENNVLCFEGDLVNATVGSLAHEALRLISHSDSETLLFDLEGITRIDSAGVAFIDTLIDHAGKNGRRVECVNGSEEVRNAQATFSSRHLEMSKRPVKPSLLEGMGNSIFEFRNKLVSAMVLIADAAWFSVTGLFRRHGIRKGEFVQQSIMIGMNALPIVGLIAFLIGFIIALQSAAQLRQFGASIFVADLIVISMTREMGPLMTAIVFAGRSGSAIASEIATMVVTEETDALKAMALNPVRYVLVPKIHAITLTMPLLTILSIIIGIMGALAISVTYLDTGFLPFYHQAVNALVFKDVMTGLVKSVVFAWIIVLVGAYYGFNVHGGAEGVGRATTASVVTSVFLVVLADSLLGLLFYFGSPVIQ